VPGHRYRGFDLLPRVRGRDGAVEPEHASLAGDLGVERLRPERAHGLATAPAGRHQPGGTQPAQVPADERLGQAHVLDEVGDGCRTLGETLDDPQPMDVGERLMETTEIAQVVGLVDDRGEGRAEAGG
jgi:hypothetical protein